MNTSYRLDRRFVMPAIGLHVIGAGVASALAYLLWPPIGVLAVLLLLNVARVMVWPPQVAYTDDEVVRLGGPMTVKAVQLPWTEVEGVGVDEQRLYLDRGDDRTLVFPFAYVGKRSDELLRDVYDRLNASNGYTRFTPGS